jgi:hypothetical protein
MKKFVLALLICFVLFPTFARGAFERDSSTNRTQEAQAAAKTQALIDVPIPPVSYFQERRTIAAWAERWDAPDIPTYVYLISYGNIIGYYVADGKPSSTRSYLLPEEQLLDHVDLGEYSGTMLIPAPDLDGTYGDNNPGIRFFTAEGVAVEWGGEGACYLYSDAPIPIDAPRLNPSR